MTKYVKFNILIDHYKVPYNMKALCNKAKFGGVKICVQLSNLEDVNLARKLS